MITRSESIHKLSQETYDLLIIGGGATGCGIALDASSRGLKTALIEARDFGSGSSGKSTKLIHGGLRYLKRAFTQFDFKQLSLVKECLTERKIILEMAPHLTQVVKLMIPFYSWIGGAYYWTGLNLYDWMAGQQALAPSKWIDAEEVSLRCPYIKRKGLRGAIEFYDGQFDDARLNLALALTAEKYGAIILNDAFLTGFEKNNEQIVAANVEEKITGESFNIKAKIIVNAAGYQADFIRHLDDKRAAPLLQPSTGSHIILNNKFALADAGFLIPRTSDGRLLFVLPWQSGTLVGTTDIPGENGNPCQATQNEIKYLLDNLNQHIEFPATPKDIIATWSGIRPLVGMKAIKKTSNLSRDHYIEKSKSGLYTVVGGKWTTFRKMAEDLLDKIALNEPKLKMGQCLTANLKLVGAETFCEWSVAKLQEYFSLDIDILYHLLKNYGDKAPDVAQLAVEKNLTERLVIGHPYIHAEVIYAIRNEHVCTVIDFLSRRIRLAFLDPKAALEAIPKVLSLMSQEFNWDGSREVLESHKAQDRLKHEFFPVA